MGEQLKAFIGAVNGVSRDIYALAILAAGIVLCVIGHKEEGVMVIGGALGIFKGEAH